jgi:hypothetical protein
VNALTAFGDVQLASRRLADGSAKRGSLDPACTPLTAESLTTIRESVLVRGTTPALKTIRLTVRRESGKMVC